jgi:Domain of unknown function (DUF4262)
MCTFCEAEQAMLNGHRALDPSLHSIQVETDKRVDQDVQRHGQHITYVTDQQDPAFVSFGYTAGRVRCNLPELVVLALDPTLTATVLNRANHEEHSGHCAFHSLDAAGHQIGRKLAVLQLTRAVWDSTDYFSVAVHYAKRHGLRVEYDPLQIVIADELGRFPWFRGYRGFTQPLLNHPGSRLDR